MTARKGTRKAAEGSPRPSAAAAPDTDKADEESAEKPVALSKDTTGDAEDPAAEVRLGSSPVKRYRAPRPAPFRAGGHVLTERGWVLDTDPNNQKG